MLNGNAQSLKIDAQMHHFDVHVGIWVLDNNVSSPLQYKPPYYKLETIELVDEVLLSHHLVQKR